MSLRRRIVLISGGSRGVGEPVAVRAARDGANVTLLAKTDQRTDCPGRSAARVNAGT
ncbi:hypothetical protein [Nocardioides immobilis]|uniref:hypothetical protein n=1 Tax=Nocardioides immobilis TaxID=2049295 RepID=UPI001C70CB5E|nr:hypothetical protein [Nocardioides immobilis]